MNKSHIDVIEHELGRFPAADQKQLSEEFASYLRRLRALREELARGDQAVAEGNLRSIADLDAAILALRKRHAGT